MTDDNGSAAAGSPEAANGGLDQGSSGSAADPLAGLETGSREWAEKNGVKSIADAVTAAREAQSLIGKSVQIPGTDAKPEDWQKVFKRLGAPETAEGYTLSLPEGVDPAVLDEAFGKQFKDVAAKAGLTPTQAKVVHDFIALGTVEQLKANASAQEAAAVKATEGLEKAFGGKVDSEEFKGAIQFVTRAINGLGGEKLAEALKAKGILSSDGAILDDTVAIAFHEIGKRYFTEAGFVTGNAGGTVNNPFAGDRAKLDWTAIHKVVKADRQGAINLMRAAGKKPSDFGLPDAA